jgi:molybdenum cofactor biosynthesis enzyme MoaA
MNCPKCGSGMINNRICGKCGTYIYPEGFSPVGLTRGPIVEPRSNLLGTCKNCHREDLRLNGQLCSSCAKAVKPVNGRKIIRDSAEYHQKLKAIRERIWKKR